MTGSGGWPLSLFLTPDGKPFYGGTYYPPDDRWGRPGFLSLLASISRAWTERRGELESSAKDLLAHLETAAKGPAGAAPPGPEALDNAVADMARQFDRVHGGFGSAPKFPPAMKLELLLRRFARTGGRPPGEMAETTLTRMAEGGMYDQVGGGFHRYSVDARWLVPHFEKMLYDNALLAKVYLFASRELGNPAHERIARETLDYLLREMTPEDGGFFAAQDADSGGEEGTFYVWTPGAHGRARRGRGKDCRRALRRHARRQLRGRPDRPVGRPVGARARLRLRTAGGGDRAGPGRRPGKALRGALAPRPAGHGRQAADGLERAGHFGFRARGPDAGRAALRGGGPGGGGPDPDPLPSGEGSRGAPPPGEGRRGRDSGVRVGLREPDRGAPRSLRGDVRGALLSRGRRAPGGSSTSGSPIPTADTSWRPTSTTVSCSSPAR